MRNGSTRVVVVGGGAAGVATASAMVREGGDGLEVRIVERAYRLGPGLAYRTDAQVHLLNNYAARMSILDDDPAHLLRWCRTNDIPAAAETFIPRHVYGDYLEAVLADQVRAPGSQVTRLRGEVVDILDDGSDYLVCVGADWQLRADVVVLALGNPPPRTPESVRLAARAYLADPWAPHLIDCVKPGTDVLLVGTGLTMVDVAAQIAMARPDARMVAASRHGRLPEGHLPTLPGPAVELATDEHTLAGLLRDIRLRLRGGADWRELVESLKPCANDLWAQLSEREREQFVLHVARHWEVARHRMAPAMGEIVDALLAEGRLTVTTTDQVEVAGYDLVVNCTGPAPVCTPGWNPLVDRLAAAGMLRAGPLGLGLDVDPDGALRIARGESARGIYAVGAARRGVEWETAAVPDLRRQASALARRIGARSSRVSELVGSDR